VPSGIGGKNLLDEKIGATNLKVPQNSLKTLGKY
jgi:hypothetical protein